jgi:hypothetical protein
MIENLLYEKKQNKQNELNFFNGVLDIRKIKDYEKKILTIEFRGSTAELNNTIKALLGCFSFYSIIQSQKFTGFDKKYTLISKSKKGKNVDKIIYWTIVNTIY